jgi:hypothetical protein
MRRSILIFLFCFLCLVIHAQPPFTDGPPYPTVALPLNFAKFEYFIDTDPGFGNVGNGSTAIAGVDVMNATATVTIPTTTLPGVHTLFVRSFVKSNNTDGNWSITNAYTFENLSPTYPTAAETEDLINLEYFFDTDPGFKLGSPIAFAQSPDVSNLLATITIPSLTPGVHQLFIRSRNAAKYHWSLTNSRTFENLLPAYPQPTATPNIIKIEYSVKSNVGFGTGTIIPITPSTNINSQTKTIDISNALPAGNQLLFIRSQDNLYRWSITNYATFNNENYIYPTPPPLPNIKKIEYFIDVDPGIGNATTLAVTPSTNINDLLQSVDISPAAPGDHIFFIRSLSNDWSLTNASVFTKDGPLPISLISFKGKASKGENILTWRTASELNNSHFEIERAEEYDELKFSKIGKVMGSGTKITDTDYTFADEKPHAYKNYYRLKQVDFDGHFEYSSAILVEASTSSSLATVYPNPANGTLVIDYADKVGAQVVSFSITDVLGRKMNVPYAEVEEELHCDVRLLPPGLYLLQLYFYGEKQTIRFIKE